MKMNRRSFIGSMALTAASTSLAGVNVGSKYPAKKLLGPKEKLNVAVVGVCGKGWTDWRPLLHNGDNIVALCDVDRNNINRGLAEIKKCGKDPSKVKIYTDFRKMFDECKGLNAATVSTPDHIHAPAAITAMRHGCHVYVQKPLVRTIWEAHYFEKVARECGVITQMGNQGSANPGFRRNVEVLQAGLLGKVKEVHVWTNRPIWPQGRGRPAGEDKIPANLDWESWIGPAPMRPFKRNVYHAFKWRGFLDFGTGAFGDMACHTMNLPFRGLRLGAVESAECLKIVNKNNETYPSRSLVKMHYAARQGLPAVDLFWYDGNLKPSREIMPSVIATLGAVPRTGCLIIGDKGMMVSTNDYGAAAYVSLNGEKKMKSVSKHPACKEIPVSLPRCKRGDHNIEFADACKGLTKCYSDVDLSIPMLEGMLVGCIAQQVPGKLNWNSEKQEFDNKLANLLVRPYASVGIRKGWEF